MSNSGQSAVLPLPFSAAAASSDALSSPCFAILPAPTTSPTHMLPAVSLPKIAKPELTTIPILGDDDIPAPVAETSAPTKPDAAALWVSTDKQAAPMEEEHEVIPLLALSLIVEACRSVHASGGLELHG